MGEIIEPVAFAGSTSIPWNNEPAPFGNPSEILERKRNEKKFLGTKKFFLGGKKLVFLKKKIQKKFWKKFGKIFFLFFFVDFFNIMVTYFDSNRFFQAKSLSYHIKQFLGLLIV